MNSKTKIINLLGGPGAGKSTVAAGVFYELKKKTNAIWQTAELVTEVAKDIVWEGTTALLENQIHIFSEQFRRQWRVIDQVDFVVTDSPLLLNSVYLDQFCRNYGKYTKFDPAYLERMKTFFDESFRQFNNVDFMLMRGDRPYETKGRTQTLAEAQNIDTLVLQKITNANPDFITLWGTEDEKVEAILSHILKVEPTPYAEAPTTFRRTDCPQAE
jgi:hypothetical protein